MSEDGQVLICWHPEPTHPYDHTKVNLGEKLCSYFIVSGEISVYLVKIKVISITSELISYHFTSDGYDYIFTLRFEQLWFSSLFQKWILPPLQIFEHL